MKLFNLVKGFFGKPASEPVYEEQPSNDIAAEYPPAEAVEPAVAESSYEAASEPEPVPVAAETVPATETAPAINTGTSEISLPLASLVSAFPVELQKRVLTARIGEVAVAFPLDKILPQLSQGLVRVTFGEIRQAQPSSFTGGADRDYVMVTLPLQELISRLGPAILAMRSRKQVEVPDEIASPFGLRGEGLIVSKPASTPGTAFTARPRGAQAAAPVPPAADPRARGNVGSVRMPSAPSITPSATPGTSFINRTSPPPSAPAAPINGASLPPVKAPIKPPIGAAPMGGFTQPPVPPAVPHRPSHGVSAPGASAPSASAFNIAFNLIEESLPEAIKLEAAQLDGVQGAMLSLPGDQVADGLKRGKVAFTWKQLRECFVPAVAPCISAHDGLVITLPLGVIAPLFLKRQKGANNGQKRVVVDDRIPNLFFGFPQPEAVEPAVADPMPTAPAAIPVVPAPKPADTNYFIFDDEKEQPIAVDEPAQAVRPQRTTPGTTFASRKATPNEVVTKASMLEGVYGALVALPDGLLVASKLDPSVNGETIAALIPQMYSKLSGCTKELRLGELNNLNFTVGNVPWKIYRVNGIFFAAFGTAGEPLPTGHLTELAAQLDYKRTQ